MATFTRQLTKAVAIKNSFVAVVTDLQAWKPVWLKAGRDKQLAWLASNKSPLLAVTLLLYIYLRKLFSELNNDIDSGKITADYQNYEVNINE